MAEEEKKEEGLKEKIKEAWDMKKTVTLSGRKYQILITKMTKRRQEFALIPDDLSSDWQKGDSYYKYKDGKWYQIPAGQGQILEISGGHILQALKEKGLLKKFFDIKRK